MKHLSSVQTGDPYDPGYSPGEGEEEYGWTSILIFLGVVAILVYGAWRSKKRGEW